MNKSSPVLRINFLILANSLYSGLNFKLPRYLNDSSVFRKPSLMVIIFSICFSFWLVDFWRPYNAEKNQHNFVWDIFHYYSYLPAFVFNEGSFDWHGKQTNFLPISPTKQYFSKVTYGMALLYAPWFVLACKVAINQKDPLDGFSEPFATVIHWGCIIYALIGLLFLRKFLLYYYSERVTALTLFGVVFGTMLFLYLYIQSESPHSHLFALFSAFLFYTKKWHDTPRTRYAVAIGIVGGLIVLVRAIDIYIFFVFFMWEIKKKEDWKLKLQLFRKYFSHLLLILVIGIIYWIPQIWYIKLYTGLYFSFYDKERFFWDDPQMINILFSYRKGLLVYTPLLLMAFVGFFFMKKELPLSRWTLIFLTIACTYVFSCWWDWAYGGCFGARPFCALIAIWSIPLASFIDFILHSEKKFALKGWLSLISLAFLFSCVCLNVGQSYQFQNLRKIHSSGMNKTIYWDVFRTYQFNEKQDLKFWVDVKEPEYEKWKEGKGRDD